MTDSYSRKELDHESFLHCCVTMKLVYKQVPFPSLVVSLLSLRNNLFTCLPSCTCFLFRSSVSLLYFLFSISCNTTLHIHLHLRTCLSVAQTGYPPPRPIRNTPTLRCKTSVNSEQPPLKFILRACIVAQVLYPNI